VFSVFFAVNNSDFVKLNLSPLGYVMEIRLFLLMMCSLAMGSLLTVLFGHVCRLFDFLNLKKLYNSRRIGALENELKKLRTKCDQLKKSTGEDENKK
jgi:uncharacterized integral membrane protein